MKRTLKYLCENEELYSNILVRDTNAILEIVSGSAYTWSITLKNATCIPDNYDCLCFSEDSLIEKEDNTYILKSTYPDYIRYGKITGLHLAESYDLSYFVGCEKNVIFHIHCSEDYFNERLSIQFLCGTEMLRKQNISSDIYACTFKAKGRRFFNTVTYEECFQDTDNDNNISSHNLETYIHIATKRAELKKLSKEERIQLTSVDISYLRLFLSIFIIMGGLFGIFMTVAFIAMAALCALLFGQPEVIPSMITEIHWWICLAFCWIAFGGIMGIITVLVKRK